MYINFMYLGGIDLNKSEPTHHSKPEMLDLPSRFQFDPEELGLLLLSPYRWFQ